MFYEFYLCNTHLSARKYDPIWHSNETKKKHIHAYMYLGNIVFLP
jgi:hypothetical protein